MKKLSKEEIGRIRKRNAAYVDTAAHDIWEAHKYLEELPQTKEIKEADELLVRAFNILDNIDGRVL